MADTKENMKKWLNAWEIASAEMDEIKRQELRNPDYYKKTMSTFGNLLNYATDNTPAEPTSGMIEMQRYFMIMGRQNGQLI